MEKLLISACLLGFHCKYTGGNNALPGETLNRLRAQYSLVPVCPETAGGLPVPREPSERIGAGVFSVSGRDVTAEFQKGAETAVRLAELFGCKKALLKEDSPSCGSGRIYDGSFSGVLIPGDGVSAEKLKALGIEVIGESAVKQEEKL